jgi:RecQ family ATP-dependent DNA helicase
MFTNLSLLNTSVYITASLGIGLNGKCWRASMSASSSAAGGSSGGGRGSGGNGGGRRGRNAGLVSQNFVKNNYKRSMRHARKPIDSLTRGLGGRFRNGALRITKYKSRRDWAEQSAARDNDTLYHDLLDVDELRLEQVHEELSRSTNYRAGSVAANSLAAAAQQVERWQSEDASLLAAFRDVGPRAAPVSAVDATGAGSSAAAVAAAASAAVAAAGGPIEEVATFGDRARLVLFERDLADSTEAEVLWQLQQQQQQQVSGGASASPNDPGSVVRASAGAGLARLLSLATSTRSASLGSTARPKTQVLVVDTPPPPTLMPAIVGPPRPPMPSQSRVSRLAVATASAPASTYVPASAPAPPAPFSEDSGSAMFDASDVSDDGGYVVTCSDTDAGSANDSDSDSDVELLIAPAPGAAAAAASRLSPVKPEPASSAPVAAHTGLSAMYAPARPTAVAAAPGTSSAYAPEPATAPALSKAPTFTPYSSGSLYARRQPRAAVAAANATARAAAGVPAAGPDLSRVFSPSVLAPPPPPPPPPPLPALASAYAPTSVSTPANAPTVAPALPAGPARLPPPLMAPCRYTTADPAAVTLPEMQAALRSVFGFGAFNPGQAEAIRNVLHAQSTLLVLPTGAGKSLCYQLPSLFTPGLTLVVSPLIALMQDQLAHLPPELPGAAWSSSAPPAETTALMDRLRAGRIKVLFVSPERVLTPGFQRFITAQLPAPGVSFVCVDEAHCVSEWSHNFRSSYLRLSHALYGTLRARCVLALTATATRLTEEVVCRTLRIDTSPAAGCVLRAAVTRPNLLVTASAAESEAARVAELILLLQSPAFAALTLGGAAAVDAAAGRARGKKAAAAGLQCSVIVYVTSQAQTEQVAQTLTTAGLSAAPYHAGLPFAQRMSTQQRFMAGKVKVVVATIAFGMGLDKQDVRAVIHLTLPRTLEHYVQVSAAPKPSQRCDPLVLRAYCILTQCSWLVFFVLFFFSSSGNWSCRPRRPARLLPRLCVGARHRLAAVARSL